MRFFPFLEKKKSKTGSIIHLFRVGSPVWTERDYAQLARESYERNAIAYRCVRLKAEAVAMLPWRGYNGDTVVDERDDFMELLLQPNPMQTGGELMESLATYLDLAGNAYLEAVGLSGVVKELYSLRPDRMKMVPNLKGHPASFQYTAGGKMVEFPMHMERNQQQPILHMKLFHPTNDVYGLSAVEAAAYAIDIHNGAGKFNKALLDNSARPSGALVYEGEEGQRNMSDEQFSKTKAEIDEQYSGPANAGRPMLLEGLLKWVEMAVNPKDLDFVEGKRESAREIALAFGVPPMLLGIPGDNTYSNYVEANRAFYRQCVLPLADRMKHSITKFLRPSFPDRRLDYDIDQIPALVQEREAHWKKVNEAGCLTNKEKRAELGFAPLGDDRDNELAKSSHDGRGDRGEDREPRDPAETGAV